MPRSQSDDTFRDALRKLTADRPPISSLRDAWTTLAGETFASHTRPIGWERSRGSEHEEVILHITADSSAWLTELARRRAQLLERLNQRLPTDIDGIEIADRPDPTEFPRNSNHSETQITSETSTRERNGHLRNKLDDDENALLDELPEDLRSAVLGAHPDNQSQ